MPRIAKKKTRANTLKPSSSGDIVIIQNSPQKYIESTNASPISVSDIAAPKGAPDFLQTLRGVLGYPVCA